MSHEDTEVQHSEEAQPGAEQAASEVTIEGLQSKLAT